MSSKLVLSFAMLAAGAFAQPNYENILKNLVVACRPTLESTPSPRRPVVASVVSAVVARKVGSMFY